MPDKKVSFSNSAAKITSVTLESNNLITFVTEDAHGLFVGALASISGVSGGPTGATTPNPVVSNVYRIDNPNSFTLYSNTTYTATSFPVTFSSSGTVHASQGSLNAVHLSYAKPVKVIRPTFFNYISPTVNAVASGNRVLLSWDASGVAYPTPTVTVGRYDSTGTTLLGSVSTAAAGSSVIDPSGTDLTAGTEFVYKVTASNTASVVSTNTSVTSLYINTPASITASATASTANSISVSWSAAVTNAVLTSYTLQRSTNGGAFATTYATTSGSVTSFTDTGLTQTDNYSYRVLANANYSSAGTGIVVSGVSATSATVTPYFISAVTPTATVTASTANSITVTWSAPVTSTPPLSSYSLQRSSNGGSTWSADLTLSSPTATTYVDSAAASGVNYIYRLAARNSQLTSAYTSSGTVTAYYLNDPLFAPTVSRTSTTTTSLTINSSYAANPSITGYNIQRAIAGTSPSYASIGATNYSITLPYVDTTVATNTSYVYQIKARNAQLTTANWSATSTAITTYGVPSAPRSFSANPSNYSIALSWVVPETNGDIVTSYTLKRGATTIYTGSNTSFTDTGLSPVTAYSYSVFATNFVGTSPTSTVSASTTAGVPSAPVLSVNSSSGGSNEYPAVYSVSWTVPANNGSAITGYVSEYLSYYNFGTWYVANTYPAGTTGDTFYVDIGGGSDIRVYAVNAVGNGTPSNEVGIYWYDANPPPPPRDD